jgi:hypothetical protein
VTFTQSTHCRVTGHLSNGIGAVCYQDCPGTASRSSAGGFAACMTATNDDNIIGFMGTGPVHVCCIHELWINFKKGFVSRETNPPVSLTDTEIGKYFSENIFRAYHPDKPVQFIASIPQLFRHQFNSQIRIYSIRKMNQTGSNGMNLPLPNQQRRFLPITQLASYLRNLHDEGINPFA